MAAAAVAAAIALYGQRDVVGESLAEIGTWPVAVSLGLALLGVGLTFLEWNAVLRGLGVEIRARSGVRVYFLSQIGKYLPGSVWPIVMQMEAGRARGASRRTMLSTSLLTLVIGCAVGLLVACALVPFSSVTGLERYWWTLVALPFLLVLLLPPVVPLLLNRLLAVVGREPLEARLPLGDTARAAGWAALSFLALGAHMTVLVDALSPSDFWELLPVCVGVMGLAICVGVLAVPVPAGLGVRDGVIVLGLASHLNFTEALLIAIASRALLVAADVLLALAVLPVREGHESTEANLGYSGRRDPDEQR
ncbi:MAG TPA: lysylphosphatidylglycerol synthase domain-containing protein [Nocardioidaceae bacterium]|nr:lysylphosphatidylglycerol synthase domain-containing protein [Nocardioidaceae bacterium]